MEINTQIKRLHVKSISLAQNEDVYDITVRKNHNFFANGILVHNCVEIGMYPVTESGVSGFQFCNLTEINGGKCVDIDTFERATKAASIMGTLQAGYTNFKYVSDATREITAREALIGVSITGWMNNPEILFDEVNMVNGAQCVNGWNKLVAEMIGIRQAARTTCVKPSGNACTGIDTKIRTERGVMSMEEIFDYVTSGELDLRTIPGGNFITPEIPLKVFDEDNALRDITAFYVNGDVSTYDIEFEDGKTYSFTGNHKLMTVSSGWKYVADLTEEDEIVSFE
jgi:hypothetical protein